MIDLETNEPNLLIAKMLVFGELSNSISQTDDCIFAITAIQASKYDQTSNFRAAEIR